MTVIEIDHEVRPEILLGRIIRQCRLRRKMSRDRLAKYAYVTASTLEKWENGERVPSLDKLEHWFVALNVNTLYREKILSLSQPALFHLQSQLDVCAIKLAPSTDELRHLDSFPFPACYRSMPSHDLIATNSAYRALFPGLTVAATGETRQPNYVEWLLLSQAARSGIKDWRRHAHVAVNSLQVLSPGLVPQQRLEAMLGQLQQVPEFATMWETDVTAADINNPELTVYSPTDASWHQFRISTYRGGSSPASWDLQLLVPVDTVKPA